MSVNLIKPWVESVILHPDVLSPDFSEDIFALDLGPLADGNKNVPAVYLDPEQFFRASYLTTGLKSLLQDVLSRLAGGAGNRVLKLITPFGVGNTPNSVLAFSLKSSKRESLDYINLLQTIDHLAARKDQRREPVEGDEVLRVIQRRLLGQMPTEADSTPAAAAYREADAPGVRENPRGATTGGPDPRLG